MIGSDRFVDIFGMVPAGDHRVEQVVKAALRAGFAIVLDRPGSKEPLCTLTARDAKTADNAARREAVERRATNVDRIRHPCGIAHVLLPTDDAKQVATAVRTVRRLTVAHGPLNIGVEPRASRMIVVDVDTPAQRDAFLAAWSGWDPDAAVGLTVASPGTVAPDGTPLHHDGGHVWFTVPDGTELPAGSGSWTHPDGWAVVWGEHQVLVPPSVRTTGPYRLVGGVHQVPADLVALLAGNATAVRADRDPDRTFDTADPMESVQARTPWSDLLGPDGWTRTGTYDACGCPIWTAPGAHASPKSATAHELGCARYDTTTGWGPLHIWTDNPPTFLTGRGNTFTLVQYVAHRDHHGNMRAAMNALGISSVPAEFPDLFELTEPDDPFVEPDPFDCATTSDDEPSASTAERSVTSTSITQPSVATAERSALSISNQEPSASTAERSVTSTSITQPSVAIAERSVTPFRLPVLPAEFWQARPWLAHIRTAALAEMCSPDAVLVGVLARLASGLDHRVRTSIGLRPAVCNLVVCPVGLSSAGKGLAMDAARDLLPPPDGARWPDGIGLGSGEGIAETFMGRIEVETGDVYRSGDRKGMPKTKEIRAQVHHNALFLLDEGQILARMAERSGATVVQALRSLWSGAVLGQANAREESTRHVPAGSYAAAVGLSFQPDTAMAVLSDTDGLAQRALWVSATHPDATAEFVQHPGPLTVRWPVVDPLVGQLVLSYPRRVCEAYRAHRAGVARGDVSEGALDGHLNLLRAKVGALLAVLDGSGDCSEEHWQLGCAVVGTSIAVRDTLLNRAEATRAEQATAARQAAAAPRVLAELRLDEIREERAGKRIDLMARTLAKRVRDAGTLTHNAARHGVKSTHRGLYEDARDHAESQGWIRVGPDGTLTVGSQSPEGTGKS